ncbi:MAG: hypothetical protein JXR83_13020 [Deltaproteobacteria bacterium]|nr:hypothetical protein [Deltaproteobacteria bacterium]
MIGGIGGIGGGGGGPLGGIMEMLNPMKMLEKLKEMLDPMKMLQNLFGGLLGGGQNGMGGLNPSSMVQGIMSMFTGG